MKTYNQVYSYIRFSSSKQEQGDSLRRQTKLANNYCEKYNLQLSTLTFQDLGKSGYKAEHLEEGGALRSFIDGVEKGDIPSNSLLLVENYDRLGRMNVNKALGLMLTLTSLNIDICTLHNEKIYSSENKMEDIMLALVEMQTAHSESQKKSERLSESWEEKRRALSSGKILTSKCPSWLKYNKKTESFEIIEKRAKVIRLIFDLYVNQGMGRGQIQKYLHNNNIKNWGRSENWGVSRLTKIISEKEGAATAIGEFQPKTMMDGKRVAVGDPIKGYYPPIIDKLTFYKAQELRVDRKLPAGPKGDYLKNLFSGLCKCHCGSNMVIVDKGLKSSGPALVCSKARIGKGCTYMPYNLKLFETALLVAIRKADLSAILPKDNKQNTIKEKHDNVSVKLKEVDKKLSNLREAIAKIGADDELVADYEVAKSERVELKARLKKLEVKLKEKRSSVAVYEQAWHLIDNILTPTRYDPDENTRRQKIASFFTNEGMLIVFTGTTKLDDWRGAYIALQGTIFSYVSSSKQDEATVIANYNNNGELAVKFGQEKAEETDYHEIVQVKRSGKHSVDWQYRREKAMPLAVLKSLVASTT